jgi:organic radical activating enzyme|tara:strand:+ start:85 stop:1341 length:1257 start_codon:yes stop_codon:yes gene_type:complete
MSNKIQVKNISDKNMSDVYCPLPFNHMNLHPNGNVGLCCVSEMMNPNSDGFYRDMETNKMLNLATDSVNTLWDKSNVIRAREQMLSGVEPPACHNCYKIEKRGGKSRRLVERERWGQNITKPRLEFLDLRMSNLCNSKCMMCNPDSSSSLASEYKQWDDALDFVVADPKTYKEYQWFNNDKIEEILEHKDTLKYMYINGGEPFMMPFHWKFLERLIEEGVAKNIHISYNTNCSQYETWYEDIWKHFKHVSLGMSVDGVDKVNEWIRKPVKGNTWEQIDENIHKFFFETPSLYAVNITNTVQFLNAPYLDDYYKWAQPIVDKRNANPDLGIATINQNMLVFPHYLSLNCASIEWKQKVKTHLEQSEYKHQILTPTLTSYLDAKEESKFLWDQGMTFLDEVEKTRKMGPWKDIFNYEFKF